MSTPMTFSCAFSLGGGGHELVNGEGQVLLEEERLSVLPKLGEVIHMSLVDIMEISSGDYKVELALAAGEKLSIFDLGYKYEDLLSNLFRFRNEMMLRYLLLNESVRKSALTGDLSYVNESGREQRFDGCEVRLYETRIVLIPKQGEPLWIHYSNISRTDAGDYTLSIFSDSGERLTLSRMGKEFDSLVRSLSDAMNDLGARVQSQLKDAIPSADPSVIRALARLMKDGKSVTRYNIESVSQEAWSALEKMLQQTPIWDGYQFLNSIARHEKIALGIKRGLMGELTGNYVWLLFPIYGKDPKFGNAIALEAARLGSADTAGAESESLSSAPENDPGGSSGGKATYFFRIVGRNEYPALANKIEELDMKTDRLISRMNQLMLDINFRREPIFLSDDRLMTEPKYARYRFAAQKIGSLKELRKLFTGRVMHSSPEQWKSDVLDLLSFNVISKDDSHKWEKS